MRFLKCFLFSAASLSILFASAQTITSPFNNHSFNCDSLSGNYSFIVAGHLHGASSNVSGFPAASLLANLDSINKTGAAFILSTGDLFLDVNEYYVDNYKKSFFNRLDIPLLNVPGNHDMSRNQYEKLFGKTYNSFTCKGSVFILLDTEKNDGSIKGEQLEMLRDQLEKAQKNPRIRNIFIASHRPVWAEEDTLLRKIFTDNTQSLISNNFEKEIHPLLSEIKNKNIYWFSGSMGGRAPASFFYHKNDNLHYIITAIRDLPRDAILKVTVNDEVTFEPFSLTGRQLQPLESYNLELWKKRDSGPSSFNWRLLPYIVLSTIRHHYFWKGFFSAVLLMIVVFLISRRRKK